MRTAAGPASRSRSSPFAARSPIRAIAVDLVAANSGRSRPDHDHVRPIVSTDRMRVSFVYRLHNSFITFRSRSVGVRVVVEQDDLHSAGLFFFKRDRSRTERRMDPWPSYQCPTRTVFAKNILPDCARKPQPRWPPLCTGPRRGTRIGGVFLWCSR